VAVPVCDGIERDQAFASGRALDWCPNSGLTHVAGELKGWNPDPFEIHEWRFFSDDGKPTLLVRDGVVPSYDPPPVSGEIRFAKAFEVEPEREMQSRPEIDSSAPQKPARLNGSSGLHGGVVQHALPRPDFGHPSPPMSKVLKVSYVVVLTAMAASVVALAVVHLSGHHSPNRPTASATSSTTRVTTASTDTSTTTPPVPSAPQPSAAVAAADLISSWAAGNQAEAQSVATSPAVATLFAGHYTSGLVISRGCSVPISPTIPLVCTYGPPGGADPTDPIYELYVSQAPGGWYVSSAKVEN
jgi:hypothetical protein